MDFHKPPISRNVPPQRQVAKVWRRGGRKTALSSHAFKTDDIAEMCAAHRI